MDDSRQVSTLAEQVHQALTHLVVELRQRGQARLPTERVLAERFAVSRTTIRAALGRLEHAGLVRRERGRHGGAFVVGVVETPPDLDLVPSVAVAGVLRDLNTVKGLPQILREQGYSDGTKVLAARWQRPPASVAKQLRVSPATNVVSLRRVRYADGETLSLEQMYLTGDRCRQYLSTDLGSLYSGLQHDFGIVVSAAVETIGIGRVGAAGGKILELAATEPVLRLERLAFNQEGTPFECSVDLFRADRTHLRVRSEMAG